MAHHSSAPDWSYHDTKKKILSIPDVRARDFCVFAYCFGGRINEICSIRPEEITLIELPNGEDRINLFLRTEKNPNMAYRNVPMNPLNEPEYASVVLNWKDVMEDPLSYVELEFFFQKRYAKLKARAEKKGLPFSGDSLVRPFNVYEDRSYRLWVRTFLDIHPHALRHLRVHHVDDNTIPGMKALTPRQFKDFFGWKRIETSATYQSRTRSQDLAERM